MNVKLLVTTGIIGFFTQHTCLSAQQSPSLKEVSSQYFRVKIENDALLTARDKTDRYFSSGIKMNYAFNGLPSRRVLSKIFPTLKESTNYYGYSIASNMYTPVSIATENIIKGDRPYAGWAYIGLTNISNNTKTATRFTTEYSVGAIGPITQQEIMQKQVHKIIKRPEPQGWKNQIANDIAVNINFLGEKRFFHASDNIELMGVVETNIGTVSNYLGVGGLLRIGFVEDYFKHILPISHQQDWQVFAFVRPMGRIVANNALLQGGMFTYYKSPYVIPKDDLNRLYMETEFGYGISFKNFNVTYSQNVRTAEFKDAKNMLWGAMAFSYGF